ncbi:MAG: hypothetical protein ABSC54_06585 [Smithellaceae bacterium]|jgi:hypothetical protein
MSSCHEVDELIGKTRQAVMANFDPEYAEGLDVTFCGQYLIDIQEPSLYTPTVKKEVLVNYQSLQNKLQSLSLCVETRMCPDDYRL